MPTKQATKQQVRSWIADRQKQRTPPPDPVEIRRQLGRDLLESMDHQRQECAR